MNTQKIDLTSQRFGRWTVLKQAAPGEGYSTRWLCECDCGTIKTVGAQLLRSGRSQSCGCLQEEIRLQSPRSLVDGDIRLRMIYRSIVGACEDPRNIKYEKFGAKGARVCDEWKNDFKAFEKWSMEHGYEAGAFLLRYDVLQGFNPWNCKWTHTQDKGQGRKGSKMITAGNETHSISEWSRKTGTNRSTIDKRLKSGYSQDEAVSPEKKRPGRKGSKMITANGETHSLAEWSRITGLHRSSIEERLLRGATPEEAVDPIRKPKGGSTSKKAKKSAKDKTR